MKDLFHKMFKLKNRPSRKLCWERWEKPLSLEIRQKDRKEEKWYKKEYLLMMRNS